MDKATRYGMAALLMDLADAGGNVKDGCHIASMGGAWMMLTCGFAGSGTMMACFRFGRAVRLRKTVCSSFGWCTAAKC
jgi:trehalose/maltose hydrolase-like predicted phosphorylase